MSRAATDADWLPLADALADGEWHSGEGLARAAGVSRAALAKRIDHLIEDWGLVIEARAGLGYRLAQPLQRLDEAAIRAAMGISAQARLAKLAIALRVDSTNEQLLHAAPGDDPQALLAETQTAGRGRRGRQWLAPFGANLLLSLAWSFPSWPARLGTLPLAIGVAAAEALAALGVPGVMLKWPNDLRIGDAKLGGILIEQRGEFGGGCRVVIGLGLNVAMRAAEGLAMEWTSTDAACAAAGVAAPVRNRVAGAVLGALVEALARFEREGFAAFEAGWQRLDLSRDRRVGIESGGTTRAGIARGIDSDGALRVAFDDSGRIEPVHAGEVSLRLAAP